MVRFVRKYGAAGAALILASQAHAELPAPVTTAITATGADLVAAITAVIVAIIAFWGLKKLGSKMGWS